MYVIAWIISKTGSFFSLCAAFIALSKEPYLVFQVALSGQEPLAGWSKQLRTVSPIPSPAQKWQ